jgi:hypothetical protein
MVSIPLNDNDIHSVGNEMLEGSKIQSYKILILKTPSPGKRHIFKFNITVKILLRYCVSELCVFGPKNTK